LEKFDFARRDYNCVSCKFDSSPATLSVIGYTQLILPISTQNMQLFHFGANYTSSSYFFSNSGHLCIWVSSV